MMPRARKRNGSVCGNNRSESVLPTLSARPYRTKKPGPEQVRAVSLMPGGRLARFVKTYRRTSSVTVVVWVTPLPVPVMVIVWFPVLALFPTLTVMVAVPEPGAAMELGLKVTLLALPSPEADKVIAELKPPEIVVVMVDVPELPLATLIDVGDALIVKFGFVPVTVSETVVVSTVLPEVPVTVML